MDGSPKIKYDLDNEVLLVSIRTVQLLFINIVSMKQCMLSCSGKICVLLWLFMYAAYNQPCNVLVASMQLIYLPYIVLNLYDLMGFSVGLSYSWSCCAGGGWRFESRLSQYSRSSFSSNQATGKVFSPDYCHLL